MAVEPAQLAGEGLQGHGVGEVRGEELSGGHAQVVADVEKHGHGGEADTVFDVIDVPGALTQGQAHVPGGHALCLSQLG